jgi:hypothetical protein
VSWLKCCVQQVVGGSTTDLVIDQIKKNDMGRACSMYEGEKMCVQVLVGKPEGKRQLEKPKRKWKFVDL